MTDELKPCPFCGGEAHLCNDWSSEAGVTYWSVWHECDGPQGRSAGYGHALMPWYETPWYTDRETAIAAWNRRAVKYRKPTTLSEIEAENAKLRGLVRDMYCLAYPSTVEWEVSYATYDKYSPCEKCYELHGGKSPCAGTAKDMTEECCAPIQANVVADRMRELGVEVD